MTLKRLHIKLGSYADDIELLWHFKEIHTRPGRGRRDNQIKKKMRKLYSVLELLESMCCVALQKSPKATSCVHPAAMI